MISQADIKTAHDRIQPHIRRTPVLDIEAGTLSATGPVSLKLEQFQHTGSFKVRGAFNTLLSSDLQSGGVVAFSGGNHGAALAYAATKLGVRSTIFAPDFAGPVKIERMRRFGAEVIVAGTDMTAIWNRCVAHAEEIGARLVHPYDDPLVLTGQGTLGLEIEDQLPGLDTLVVSVGGGGLIGGIASWFAGRVRIVAVESEGTATLATAFSKGREIEISGTGIAASALGAATLGEWAFRILGEAPAHSVLVSDADITQAQQRLWDDVRIVGEPGAATALAALTSGAYTPAPEERVAVLVCGANAQPDWFIPKSEGV
ncbi:MAG: threonine/serine dehydratase [Alphaproteobacteria bacterium]|nr:threonine/serine dehydratase [Alphaproteobacteria bacterium]